VNVLALNGGSSALKYQVVTVDDRGEITGRPVRDTVERIGGDYRGAVGQALDAVASLRVHLDAVTHRVVHGGDRTAPASLDAATIAMLDALVELAPLHNEPAVATIRAARERLPSIPHVAVFDTAFHTTLPERAREYAIPRDVARKHGIRRYGFHGLAYRSVLARYAVLTSTAESDATVVALHLGSGCSAVAIAGGRSIDTSMGMTPLEGLVMRTRSGDLDPAIVPLLVRREGVDAEEVHRWLEQRSGLSGLAGGSGDVRDLLTRVRSDAGARLAIDVFCYRARKYVGAYLAALGGAQAVIFSGGIGEHQPEIRARICEGFGWAGLELDGDANRAAVGGEARISAASARLAAWVIVADEEAVMARDAWSVIRAG
jgi:acetate kinase